MLTKLIKAGEEVTVERFATSVRVTHYRTDGSMGGVVIPTAQPKLTQGREVSALVERGFYIL